MGQNMKVVWIIKGIEGFGISRAILSIAAEFRNRNISIEFISLCEGRLKDMIEDEGYAMACLDMPKDDSFDQTLFTLLKKIPSLIGNSYVYAKKISDLIQQKGYNRLIYKTADLTSIVAMIKGVDKYWIMPNEISNKYPLSLNKRLYQLICKGGRIKVIANSAYTASTIRGWGLSPLILHLGVDEKIFNPDKLKAEKQLFLDNAIVFGIFARMTADKAQDLVIRALHKVKEEGNLKNVKLLLVGADFDSKYCKDCQLLISELKMTDDVLVLGNQKNIQDFYSEIDVLINSRRDAEPFGLTVVEAMLMAKPVLAYSLGGPSETIVENETGWFVHHPTVEGYYAGLKKALQDRQVWTKLGENGRNRALGKFTSSNVVSNLLEIIK